MANVPIAAAHFAGSQGGDGYCVADGGFVRRAGPPPVAGRMFGFDDQGQEVAVVNGETAPELFGRQTVEEVIHDPSGRPIEVIGIVKRRSGEANLQARPIIYYGSGRLRTRRRPLRTPNKRCWTPMEETTVNGKLYSICGPRKGRSGHVIICIFNSGPSQKRRSGIALMRLASHCLIERIGATQPE